MGVSDGGLVLIGSGPSLNDVDLSRLAGWSTLAFNRSYLAWDEWPFRPTFYACLDRRAVAVIGPDLEGVVKGCRTSFLHRTAIDWGISALNDDVVFCDVERDAPPGAGPPLLHDFGNVGATSLQIVAALGFRTVVLVGVDAYYGNRGDADVAAGRSDRTISGQTTGVALRRGRPISPCFSEGWPRVAAYCEAVGLKVFNASSRTQLACFPRVDLDAALALLSEETAS